MFINFCTCVCVCVHAYGGQRIICGSQVFHHVCPRDQIQVIKLGSKHLEPLNHVPGTDAMFE